MEERDRLLLAVTGTDPTAHAYFLFDSCITVINLDGGELAVFAAVTTGNTQFLVYGADKAGGGQHGCTALVSSHGTTAAGAAVADRIKASQHGVLEERVVDMTALLFSTQDLDRLA